MRLRVVYDNEGTILAAAAVGDDGDLPVPQEGERTDEYDVPVEEGGELSEELGEVVKGLQVDVRANQLTQRA
jgi:hypothetical protein